MFRAFTDGGKTFGEKMNLSNSSQADSQEVEIATFGNNDAKIFVSWWERNQTIGRWIFPSLLGIYFTVYTLVIYQADTNNSLDLSPLDSLMKWFYALPLT